MDQAEQAESVLYEAVSLHNGMRICHPAAPSREFDCDRVQNFYAALSVYESILYRPSNLLEFRLAPGTFAALLSSITHFLSHSFIFLFLLIS